MKYVLCCVLALLVVQVVSQSQCGNEECQQDQYCLSEGPSSSEVHCVNSNDWNAVCTNCNFTAGQQCYSGFPVAPYCACYYNTTASGSCGVPCGTELLCDLVEEQCVYSSQTNEYVCVNTAEVAQNCYAANCNETTGYCTLVNPNPVTVQCRCYGSGDNYPDCDSYTCGPNATRCTLYERCVSSPSSGEYGCVDGQQYDTICGMCNSDPFATCEVNFETDQIYCGCSVGGTYPDCFGEQCGSTYCTADEGCYFGQSGAFCVNYTAFYDFCSECQGTGNGESYARCSVIGPNNFDCTCTYEGTPPFCTGPPCGNSFCNTNEFCTPSDIRSGQMYCINRDLYFNCSMGCQPGYPSSTCFATPTANGVIAECKCLETGTPPNCKGKACGPNKFCEIDEDCLPNIVDGAAPVCVKYEKMGQCQCDYFDEECKGVIAIPDNFGQCGCIRPYPSNPSLCQPTFCSGTRCDGPNQACVLNAQEQFECTCLNGFILNKLTRDCEVDPIFRDCVPCNLAAPGTKCGCGAGQICERVTSSQYQCLCAPDFVVDPSNDRIVCVPKTQKPFAASGYCVAFGDPHMHTFDSRQFTFQSRCDYVLVNSSTLVVHLKTDECLPAHPNPSVSCPTVVGFLTSGGHKVEIGSYGYDILVDDTVVSLPQVLDDGTNIYESGVILAETPEGGLIVWGNQLVVVKLPSSYSNSVSGLCGNFDGSAANDLVSRTGQVIDNPMAFADKWTVGPADPQILESASTCSVPNEELAPYPFCYNEYTGDTCEPAEGFFECAGFYDLARIYGSCVADSCYGFTGTNTTSLPVTVLESWAQICFDMLEDVNITSGTCNPPCSVGQTCSFFPNKTFGCLQEPCHCPQPDRQDCTLAIGSNGALTPRCTCKTGFSPNPVDTTLCAAPGECGSVNCSRPNEYCSVIQDATGAVKQYCSCKDGFVRDLVTGNCLPQEQTPVLGGCVVCTSPNQTNCGCPGAHQFCFVKRQSDGPRGTCLCEDGWVYVAANASCVPLVIIPVLTPAICQAYGDPHYTDLDGSYFDNQECADANMYTANDLTVHVRQGECWPSFGSNSFVKCAKAIAMNISNNIIEINDEQANFGGGDVIPRVYVNGAFIGDASNITSYSVGSVATISASGGYSVTVVFGSYTIEYRRYFGVSITVPASKRNSTYGLCGNFNGVNDETGTRAESVIGNSTLFRLPHTQCGGITKRDAVVTDVNCQLAAVAKCGAILQLNDQYPGCDQLLDLVSYYQSCLLDYCELSFVGDFVVQAAIEAAESRCGFQTTIYNEYISTTTASGSTTGPTSGGGASTDSSTSNPVNSNGSTLVASFVFIVSALMALVM